MAGRSRKYLPRCGAWARTRRRRCQAKVEPGRKRCRFHGGLSTGPKTPEGKRKVAEARSAGSKASWAKHRALLGLPPWWRFDRSRRKGARQTAARYLAEHGPWQPEAERAKQEKPAE